MTYGGHGAHHHAVVLGLRERGQRRLAHHRADVLDDGHVVEPGRDLPGLVLAGVGPELHHHLRPRDDRGGHGGARDPGVLGHDDLRGTVPTITPSYSGFVNGDNASSLSSQPTCSTTATASLPVGNYASSCSGAADSNYTITYVSGLGHGRARRRSRSRPRRAR